jgi:phospholipid transport system transporter-binding protein
MIRALADNVEVSGPMTMAGAAPLLAEGEAAIAANARRFRSRRRVTEMDSSCLAVIFGWMRAATAKQVSPCASSTPPRNLLSLAAVYGVADLLPQH